MTTKDKKIAVSKELSQYITPLNTEEFRILEQNIIEGGCKDPLVVWQKDDGQNVLIDGHNRLKICQKHGIPFNLKTKTFDSLDEVKAWMLDNQMGRRNLTQDQLSYYRGLKYLTLRKTKGGYQNVKAKGVSAVLTSEFLAERFNVSESTVKRDAKFAEGLTIVGRSNPALKVKILSGEAKVKKADVRLLAEAENAGSITIKNEGDLYNKAKHIRETLLSEIESKVKSIDEEKLDRARQILSQAEPVFLNKEDQVRKIKGMIITSINRAITKKDAKAIKDLKGLVDALENLIFD